MTQWLLRTFVKGGSVSVIADGLNNLLDAVSSVISLVGFRVGAKKADREHYCSGQP